MVIYVVFEPKIIFVNFFWVKTLPYRESEILLILSGGQTIFCHKTSVYCIQNDHTDHTKYAKKTEIEKSAIGPRNVEKNVKIWPFSRIGGFWTCLH